MRNAVNLLFCLLFLAPIASSLFAQCPPDTLYLQAAADNTLYEDSTGLNSNGVGQYFFIGKTGIPELRRALIKFDIAGALPPGSVISETNLTMYMSRTNPIAPSSDAFLHECLADWGEGTSDAPGNEGTPALATAGDATWFNNIFPSSLWTTPGGDYAPTASGSVLVDTEGYYTWTSTPQMVTNLQNWLDTPAANFGWEILGREDTVPNAKRFNTHENPDSLTRPSLQVIYTPPASLISVDLGVDTTICLGVPLSFDATYPNSTYLWSTGETTPSISVTTTGVFHVTVTDTTSGCVGTAIDTVTVGDGTVPYADFSQSADSVNLSVSGEVVFSDSSSLATEWCWDFGDGNTSTAMSPTHTYSSVGTYTVSQFAKNGACQDTATSSVVVFIMVTIDKDLEPEVKVYPNPTQDFLRVFLPEGAEDASFELLDAAGKRVWMQDHLSNGENQLSLAGLPVGRYFFRVSQKGAIIKSGKVLLTVK